MMKSELIRKLEKQCWSHTIDGALIDGHLHFDTKKFAELIVRECASVAHTCIDDEWFDVGGAILDHFGVKK